MFRFSMPRLGAAASTALVAALVFPLVGAWRLTRTRDALLADAEQNMRTLSHSLAQHAARTIESVDIVLSDVVERVQNPDGQDLNGYLERRAAQLKQSRNIVITDANGDWLRDSAAPHRSMNSGDRAFFAWHRSHAEPALHIGDLIESKGTGDLVIPVSRRIDDSTGNFDGVVIAALLPAYFQEFYRSLDVGSRGAVSLWSSTGALLARYPAAANTTVRDPRAGAWDSSSNMVIRRATSPIDGVERIAAFEHLETYPLTVSAAISIDDALGPWWHEATIEGAVLAGGAVALVVLALGLERHRRAAERDQRLTRKADGLYRLLATNSSDLIVVMAKSSRVKIYVSPSSERIVGWTPWELAGLPTEDYVNEADLPRVRDELASLSAERPRTTSVHRVRHKAGHEVWVDVVFELTHDDVHGESIVVTARDVTDRKTAEEAIKKSEALYRLLADSSSDIVARLSLDGTRQYVSPASAEILGFAPDELVGTNLFETTHPDDADRLSGLIAGLATNGVDRASNTHRAWHKLGHWVWVDVHFRLVRNRITDEPAEIVCSVRDVSRRETLQQQVAAAAHLLHATLESMDQGLIVLARDGRVKVSNNRARAMLASRSADDSRDLRLDESWLKDGPVERRLADGRIVEVRQTAMPDGASLVTLSDISHLKRAESQAREANRLLLMAEEVAHMGHWRIDYTTQSLSWSDEVFRIHGLDPATYGLQLETAIARFHPEDRQRVAECVSDSIRSHRNFEFSLRIVRPDGEIRHVLSRGICEIDRGSGDVSGIFGVMMDVTDATLAQRQLREKSAHLEATLDNMDQGLVKVAADGTIELANKRFADLFDVPAALLEQRAPSLSAVKRLLQERGDIIKTVGNTIVPLIADDMASIHQTYELSRPDGWVVEVRTVPLPGGAMVRTYSDISARRRAEDAVRDSEARYRMLADTTSDVITQLDLDLRRRYVSPSSRVLLGFEPEEMLGVRPWACLHPDDATEVRQLTEQLASGAIPGDRATTTYRMMHKAGHWVWVEASISVLRDPDTAAPRSLICSLRDVTERQRAARHLERAKTAAENAARQKSEFVANMSHELRTPLTGILGIHDLLQADATIGVKQRRYLDMARDASRSLLSIVNDVLDFSKIDAGELVVEKAPFNLLSVVDACRDLASEAVKTKGLIIDASVVGRPVVLLGDAARLKQILLNLLMNAVKFTEQGSVTLEARYDCDSSQLRFEIIDTGIGIPADKLSMMFRRFSQADASITRRYGGTGLGLAICKRLTELMGGQIGVTSEVGRGSTFWLELPAREVLQDASPATRHTAMEVPRRRVLLAEDNIVNQEIITAMLEQQGHDVTVVDNGAAAAAAAGSRPGFNVILMDLQMPIMDGLSATRAIRVAERAEHRAPTPIIGLTANAMVEDVERCLSAGMEGHVAKPVDWADLFEVMDRVTAVRRQDAPNPDLATASMS